MNRLAAFVLCSLFSLFTLISIVNAADESFADQFISSPLLVLLAIFIIDFVALIYRRIRK
jgi:hypothetical protein